MQLPFTELMCGEDHIGKEYLWTLEVRRVELISEGDASAVRNASFWRNVSWRVI